MPIKSDISLTSVTYDKDALTLTWVCVAGSENQYSGKLLIDGVEPTGTYTAWGDTGGVLTILTALTTGAHTAQLINGDNESSNVLNPAFTVSASGARINDYSMRIGIGIGL